MGYCFGFFDSSLVGFFGFLQVTGFAVAAVTVFTSAFFIELGEGEDLVAGFALFFKTGEQFELFVRLFLFPFVFPFYNVAVVSVVRAGFTF